MGQKKGFTLIELMIVVAIIGILAAVAIPQYISFKKKSTIAVAAANLEQVRAALSQYMTDNDDTRYPTATEMQTYNDMIDTLSNYGLRFPKNDMQALKWQSYVGYQSGTFPAPVFTLSIQPLGESGIILRVRDVGVCCSDSGTGRCGSLAKDIADCS